MIKQYENRVLWELIYGLSLLVFFFAFDPIDIIFYLLELVVCYCLAPLILIDSFLRFCDRAVFRESRILLRILGIVVFCLPVVMVEGFIISEVITYRNPMIGIGYHIYGGLMILSFLEFLESYFDQSKPITAVKAGVAIVCGVGGIGLLKSSLLLGCFFTGIYFLYLVCLLGNTEDHQSIL